MSWRLARKPETNTNGSRELMKWPNHRFALRRAFQAVGSVNRMVAIPQNELHVPQRKPQRFLSRNDLALAAKKQRGRSEAAPVRSAALSRKGGSCRPPLDTLVQAS